MARATRGTIARMAPRIAVTLSNPARAADPDLAAAKNRRYLEALKRAGAEPLPLIAAAGDGGVDAVLASMDGLLISGGADLDPSRFGAEREPATRIDPARDALDARAWDAAERARVPVLGICRGMQAINVFAGGSLVQDVAGHVAAGPSAPVVRHAIRLVLDTRLGRVAAAEELEVNSFHHQAVRPDQLGTGLRVSATASHEGGTELVEALESTDDERWVVGIQCHPERTETSPPVLEGLWAAFVAACGRVAARR